MLSLAKVGSKMAIVGGALYVTVDNSIWDKSDYAKGAISKVKTSLPETTELLKDIPSTNTMANTWNKGVETVFQTIGNSGEVTRKAINYVSNQK